MRGPRKRPFFAAILCLIAVLLAPGSAPAQGGVLDPTWMRLSRVARGVWRPTPAPTPIPYGAQIRAAALRHGLSPTLLAALVRVESNFDRRAVSRAGARGLGQLMPLTAHELGVRDSFDAAQNLDGAARYLARQLDRFGDVRLALGAYNAGPHRAARGLASLPDESRRYVRRVMAFERVYRRRHQL